nr:hypothetical protein [Paenibacillus periandrae]
MGSNIGSFQFSWGVDQCPDSGGLVGSGFSSVWIQGKSYLSAVFKESDQDCDGDNVKQSILRGAILS